MKRFNLILICVLFGILMSGIVYAESSFDKPIVQEDCIVVADSILAQDVKSVYNQNYIKQIETTDIQEVSYNDAGGGFNVVCEIGNPYNYTDKYKPDYHRLL